MLGDFINRILRTGRSPELDDNGNLYVTGTVTATVDTSALATQATLAAILAALRPPGSHTAITPSDSTDVTAIASLGLQCTVAGNVSYRGTTTSGTTVTQPVVAGQYVWGEFSRVMAATTATMIGLAP